MSKDNKSVNRRRKLKVRQQYNGSNKGEKYQQLHRKHIEQHEPQQKAALIALVWITYSCMPVFTSHIRHKVYYVYVFVGHIWVL